MNKDERSASTRIIELASGIQVFSQVNKYTLSYRFLYGNIQGWVFAKNRPVSLNWTDYNRILIDGLTLLKYKHNSEYMLMHSTVISHSYTVKPVLSAHSKIDKTQILMTNGSLN